MPASGSPLRRATVDLASTGGARGSAVVPPASPATTEAVLRIVARYRDREGPLLPILHDVQHELGCIGPETAQPIADALNLSRAEVHGVVTFYPHFRTAPAGRHVIEVCRAEACQSRGGEQLAEHARRALGCDFHETSPDGAVSLQPVYCLGLCAQSPSIMIDGKPHARVTPEKFDRLVSEVRP